VPAKNAIRSRAIRLTKHEITASQPIILAIDTSSKATSLAVARGETVLQTALHPPDQTRSERLWIEVSTLLSELGMSIRDVDVFSVCTGPGGFTGLRVGMAAVMGFSAASDKPVVGITSLEAAAFASAPAKNVCAVVNAYKGEVYSQLFSVEDSDVPTPRNDPMVSTVEKALDRVADKDDLVLTGDGAEAVADQIANIAGSLGKVSWKVKGSECGLAGEIARLAFIKHRRGEIQGLESLQASYVRPSEAEIKLSLGLLGSKIKRSMSSE
jgi:tRNA threonylcarbamoyladenosine biosynthesis protein TsaB